MVPAGTQAGWAQRCPGFRRHKNRCQEQSSHRTLYLLRGSPPSLPRGRVSARGRLSGCEPRLSPREDPLDFARCASAAAAARPVRGTKAERDGAPRTGQNAARGEGGRFAAGMLRERRGCAAGGREAGGCRQRPPRRPGGRGCGGRRRQRSRAGAAQSRGRAAPRRAAGEVLRGAAGTGGGGERGGRHPRAAAAPELGRPRVLSEGFGRTGGAAVCGGSRSPRRCPPSAPRLLETRAPELGCARSAGLRLSHVAAERISRFRSGKRNATRAAGCSPAGSAEPRSRQRPRQRQRQPRAGTAPPRGSAAAGGLREAPDGREKLGCSARLPCPDVPFVPLIFARVTAPMDACGVN